MRYIFLTNKITLEEKKSRKDFIEKVTNLYFIPVEYEDRIEYISIPSSAYDCLFIVGHNIYVRKYLLDNNIPEKNIVIVSCKIKLNSKFKKNKTIYVSYNKDGKTNFYNGKDWGLYFYVSKEELKLINSTGAFIDRVENYFRKMNNGKDNRKIG